MTEDYQRQGLCGGKIGGWQIIAAANVILLLILVIDQWHARGAQQFQVAENRAPAHATLLRQALNVISSSSLKQAD